MILKKSKWVLLFVVLLFSFSFSASAKNDIDTMSPEQVYEMAMEAGTQYNISPELLQAIAFYESSYNPNAQNGSCKGLMQVSEKWHWNRMERLDVNSLYDPYGNMLVAADYLYELFVEYEDVGMVLMTYNGDSSAHEYQMGNAKLSAYAEKILKKSEELEQEHGK